ncbi:hypothetical protein N7492_007401 [Penicillium capsulatum]|uniref:Crh-like protein n=1 Tax=Penicillium capsulatum TaxID=69766 RepID=A0A9W9I183_9EURO|nr:hypothetical protein N7492_007401 [Penicillium capsulatum]KAJ6117239.1 hypothetical protein N7512_006964 [Penicillium capsulatum]
MPSFFKYAVAALAAAAPITLAQTSTECDPTKKSCPDDTGSTESTLEFDFTKEVDGDMWKTTAGKVNTGSDGGEFKVAKKGDAPTIQSKFFFHYGKVDVVMKAAPGTGIVSSIVLESDDLDEIDWETIGSKTDQIETNYFGKGDHTTYDRETWVHVDAVQEKFHKYSLNWQEDKTEWLIDDKVVRTLNYKDAKDGSRYPQTPMGVRLGIWAGGDSDQEGTVEWAGGKTDHSKGPFSMYVKSVKIQNKNPAKAYHWSDQTGSSKSIKKVDAADSSLSQSSSSSTSSSDADSSSTTLATTTGSSSSTTTTTSGSGSSSSGDASSSSSSSSSGSSSDSGSSGSGTSSEAGSATGSGASASPTASYGAAANMVATYFGPMSLLTLVAAFFQL